MNTAPGRLKLAPQDADAAVSRAFVLQAAERTDEAWPIVQELIQRGQITGRLGVVFSRMAPKLKREGEALEVLGRALAAGKLNPREERGLRFAAAGLLDRLERYDEAFNQAQIANRLRAVHSRYIPQAAEQSVDGLIAYFTRDKLASLPRAQHENHKKVFIVGMPRSGTSLIEQILASHPQVSAGGELPYLPRVVEATPNVIGVPGICISPMPRSSHVGQGVRTGGDVPQCQCRRCPRRRNRIGERRKRDQPFTDKLPLNFLHLGLIWLLFPRARVIHCLRDPLDVCLSCHMTDFASDNEFSF